MLKNTVLKIIFGFFMLLVSSCSIFPKKIEGNKIKEIISNKTLFFYVNDSWKKMVSIQGKEYIDSQGSKTVITKTIFVKPDGRFLYKTDKNKMSTGIWHQDNNKVCFNSNGEEICGYINEVDDSGLEDGIGGCTEYPDKCRIYDTQKLKNVIENKLEYSGLGLVVYKDNGSLGFMNSSGNCVKAPNGYQLPLMCTKKSYSFHDEIKSNNMAASIKSGKVSNLYVGEKFSFVQGDIESLESTYEITKINNPLEAKKSNNIHAYLKFAHEYKSKLDALYKNANTANFSDTAMQTLMKERDSFSNKDFFDIYMEDFGTERFVEIYVAQIESLKANNLYLAALKSENLDAFESLLMEKQKKYFLILNEQQRNNITDALKKLIFNQKSTKAYILLFKSTNNKQYIVDAIELVKDANDEQYLVKEFPEDFFKIGANPLHKKGEKNDWRSNLGKDISNSINGQDSATRINGLSDLIVDLYVPHSSSTTKPIFDIPVYPQTKYGTYKLRIKFNLETKMETENVGFTIFINKETTRKNYEKIVDFIVSPGTVSIKTIEFNPLLTHFSVSIPILLDSESKVSIDGFKANIISAELN
ncbi:MAG: hypothetical protein NTV43_15010 [Methylococcales bacterium]|nr:hypothetical protein [Methylococcales bacterium]